MTIRFAVKVADNDDDYSPRMLVEDGNASDGQRTKTEGLMETRELPPLDLHENRFDAIFVT